MSSPSAARIAAPPDDAPDSRSVGPLSSLFAPTANSSLLESLMRGPEIPLTVNPQDGGASDQGAMIAMAARSGPIQPATQALSPSAIREQGQAFLRSIKG